MLVCATLAAASVFAAPQVARLEVGGVALEASQTLRTRANAGLSKTMFATSNQINSSTIIIDVVAASVNLWSGVWSPSPVRPPAAACTRLAHLLTRLPDRARARPHLKIKLDPPMSGSIPSIKSGACYHSGCHGFTAAGSATLGASHTASAGAAVTNGSFILEPAQGSGMTGYIGVAFAQVGQEFIVEVSKPGGSLLNAEVWGVEVGDTMVYTLVLKAHEEA